MSKKKQSQHRNADTQFMNNLWREMEQTKSRRSREIRDRERRARERARSELFQVLDGWPV
jgi:hypothetical protein